MRLKTKGTIISTTIEQTSTGAASNIKGELAALLMIGVEAWEIGIG